jgi:hypothetical protein
MSHAYRPNYKSGSWKQKQLEEQARKKLEMNETNFPKLSEESVGAPKAAPALAGDSSFAALATDWKAKEDTDKIREQIRKQDAANQRMMDGGVFIWRGSKRSEERSQGSDNEVDAPQPKSKVDAEGWEQVDRNTIKPKRAKTDTELEQFHAADNGDFQDDDHNEHLLDGHSRREFY